MPRTYLSSAQRRAQILDQARWLFVTRGYESTTIADILAATGIAKGTLYHHFASKEAILEALVERTVAASVERARQAAAAPGEPLTRFFAALTASRVDVVDIELAEQFHGRDATFHLLTLTAMFDGLVPVLTQIVEDGVASGDFHTSYPREAVEVVMAAGSTLLDGGIFDATPEQVQRRFVALMATMERLLGARPGSAALAVEWLSQEAHE